MIPKIRLDWKSYFRSFDEAHGGSPVDYGTQETRGRVQGGVLLWRDGWRYSRTDYAGPEFPPPSDENELRKLRISYWRIRRNKLKSEKQALGKTIEFLAHTQQQKDQPLVHSIRYFDDDRWQTESQQVDIEGLRAEYDYLIEQITECDGELKCLSQTANM